MAGSRGALEEAAVADESQANLVKSFADFLKQHRPIFYELKEMFERFMDMESNETTATQNSDLNREDEQDVREKRKKEDLHYKKKLAEKDKRIMQLERELKERTLENEKLCKEKGESIASWREEYCKLQKQFKNSTDAYFKEIDAINGEKTELIERISTLQKEVTSKDLEMVLINSNKEEQIQEYRDRFNKLKEQYEEATSRNDQELRELNFSYDNLTQVNVTKDEQVRKYAERNEYLTQQIRTKEDKVKEYEAKYNRLTEECKGFLANKDEELKGIKKRNEDLTQQIRSKEDQVKEYEAKYNRLTEEYEGLLAKKDEELKGIKTRFSEFKERCRVFVEGKDEELKKMKTRLACLSEKQVQKDQRKVEDTTSSNRPSEVEKDFTAFFDDQRMDACEKMQEVYGSEEESEVGISYPRLACMIFETAYEEIKETKAAVLTLFKVISKSMIDRAPTMGAEYASRTKGRRLPYNIPFNITPYRPELEYPIDVFDALVISLKETAHKCDLVSLERGVKRKIKEKWLQWLNKEKSCRFSFSEYLLEQLSDYIKACIRLTWRMVTQVPPMQLEYQSATLLKDIHKNLGYHSSPEMCSRRSTTEGQASNEELEIACYLWPALLDGGGKLIRAGEVVCKVKEL